jgi:hypothetical protein
MLSAQGVQLTGVLEADPQLTPSVDGGTACQFVFAAAAQVFTVVVSSQHAQWIASTISAGVVVQVTGTVSEAGGQRLIHAWQVQRAHAACPGPGNMVYIRLYVVYTANQGDGEAHR